MKGAIGIATQQTSKSAYQRAMRNYKLENRWTKEHTKTFIKLKGLLTSEPTLKSPRWDGTPFIITTDGSKDALAGVLAQRSETILPGGKVVSRVHPIAFASKRTSPAEEKYKPFLFEFAALKFSLDKFSDIIWGSPIELKTDCQALRDFLLNDKLNATHARWRDGILAHNIIGVRHVPGKMNVVADGISRWWEGQPKKHGDGSEWTVSEDWEAATGLVHDLFLIASPDQITTLRKRF